MKKTLLLNLLWVSGFSFASNVGYNPTQAAQFETTNKCIQCDLTGYHTLSNKNRVNANLKSSNLSGAYIGDDRENWNNANLTDVILTNRAMVSGDFSDSDFSGSDLIGAQLRGIFNQVKFVGDVIRDTNIYGSIQKADFSGAYINSLRLGNTDATKANFSNSVLVNSDLGNGTFDTAKFNGARLTNTNFHYTKDVGADFTNADLTNVDFSQADLTGANLTNANLCNSNITREQIATVKSVSCAIKPDCRDRYPDTDGGKCS